MSSKATQSQKILKYMEDFGWITPMDAIVKIGCTKLATRISELIAAGFKIEKKMVRTRNKWGEPTHYMKYRMGV